MKPADQCSEVMGAHWYWGEWMHRRVKGRSGAISEKRNHYVGSGPNILRLRIVNNESAEHSHYLLI